MYELFTHIFHELRTLELLQDNFEDNPLYLLLLKLSHNYVALHETTFETIPMYLSFHGKNIKANPRRWMQPLLNRKMEYSLSNMLGKKPMSIDIKETGE